MHLGTSQGPGDLHTPDSAIHPLEPGEQHNLRWKWTEYSLRPHWRRGLAVSKCKSSQGSLMHWGLVSRQPLQEVNCPSRAGLGLASQGGRRQADLLSEPGSPPAWGALSTVPGMSLGLKATLSREREMIIRNLFFIF